MNVLVTGDRGYIGSVLVKKLLKEGFEVVGLDSGFFERNLLPGIREPKYKKITKDIRKVKLTDLKGVNAIIHLSALSNDPMGEIDPDLTEDINHKASVRLARLAKRAGVKKFIFSSSCSIYGIAKNGVVDESSKVNPLTAYARAKIKTENALKKLASSNFFVGLLRNSTVYGFSPRFRNDLVINNLVTTALAYNEIRIQSDGTPWRPFIDVWDLSKIFVGFLAVDPDKINGKIINVGFNDNNFQVKDIVSIVKKHIPNCKIVYMGKHGKDTRSYKVNFDKFHRLFPQIKQEWTLERSVKDLVKNLRKIGFGRKEFESGTFTRLAGLKKLLSSNTIDSKLYWR